MNPEKVISRVRRPAGDEREAGTFTRYIEALAARSDSLVRLADELLAELRDVLTREMHRRSLWTSPPSYVGIYGCAHWTPATEARIPTTSPLDELLSDCYVYIFGTHLPQLLDKARVNSIDGLVVFLLRNFLSHRQKIHDPLGYRVFEVLHGVVRAAVKDGELYVVMGDERIRNDTVLAVTPGANAKDAAPIEILRPIVARWNDTLLPGLVIAMRYERTRLNASLREHLFNLEADGVAVFGFKPLVDTMKEDVRARWAMLYDQEEGETAVQMDDESRSVVRVFRPDQRSHDAAAFERLLDCVTERIEKSGEKERTRRYLQRLWGFLRHFVYRDDEEALSQRGVAEMLSIPRGRLAALYEGLGQFVRRCQGLISGTLVEMGAIHHGGDDNG